MKCLINGQDIATLAISDRSIHYGDGLFETIALKHGVMSFWSDHYQRLISNCERLKILKPSEALLLDEINIVKQTKEQAVIKIILTRGNGERGYPIPETIKSKRIVQCYPYPQYPESYYKEGIRTRFCTTPVCENTALAGIKHLNRLDNVMASSEWNEEVIAEGFMCNAKLEVIQGTKSNLFCVRENILYTPDLTKSGILGIMRAHVLHWAGQQQWPIKIAPISRDALLSSDEIFICNSIFGIWPVNELEGHVFSVGPYTRKLLTHFE